VYQALHEIAELLMRGRAVRPYTSTNGPGERSVSLAGCGESPRLTESLPFFAAASALMRRILADQARADRSERGGEKLHRVVLDQPFVQAEADGEELIPSRFRSETITVNATDSQIRSETTDVGGGRQSLRYRVLVFWPLNVFTF
jgi:hypothetical protein